MIAPSVVRDAAVDWVKFDAELARDGTVDPVDKALYAALASFVPTSNERATNPDPDGWDSPTRRVLAACIGRSVDTVDRATKRLEERGLLKVERRQDPDNPRSHIPSVYRLLDHERWDEKAAARAAARMAQRAAEKAKREEDGEDVAAPVRPGWPQACGEGSRTGAARGGRTSAAVPLLYKKSSLSETRDGVSDHADNPAEEERETTATPKNQTPPGPAAAVAQAWATARGGRQNPASASRIRAAAADLLAAGWPVADVTALAVDMARRQPTWTDLSRHADHWQAPTPSNPAGSSSPDIPPWCGECGDGNPAARFNPRFRTSLDPATGSERDCPACHPAALTAA